MENIWTYNSSPVLEVSGHEHEVQLFFDLSTLISMINSIQLALGKTVVDGAAIITISAPEPSDFPYHELEHCSFEFNAERLTMRIPKTWLDLPFESHNEKLKLAAIERCEQEMRLVRPADLIEKVRVYLNALEGPLPSIEHIAAEFFMSPATLKRRLSQLNSSYLDIKNEIRLARATALLTDSNKQIETIAEDLGFSDNSNFTKFFKKITGKTPKEYRNQNT